MKSAKEWSAWVDEHYIDAVQASWPSTVAAIQADAIEAAALAIEAMPDVEAIDADFVDCARIVRKLKPEAP